MPLPGFYHATTLASLLGAVQHHARAEDPLLQRLRQADEQYLQRFDHGELDDELRGDLAKVRAAITEGAEPWVLPDAADTLVSVLVRYARRRERQQLLSE